MKRFLHRGSRLRVAVVLALALCHTGCTGNSEAESVARQAAANLSARAGVPVEVTCPEFAPERVNVCQVKAKTGETFAAEIQRTPEGSWNFSTDQVTPGKELTERIIERFASLHQTQLSDVTCPAFVMRGGDQPTSCRARVQGVEVVIDLVAEPDGFAVTPGRGFMFPRDAARFAREELARQGVEAEVACGPKLLVPAPYSQFTCTAKGPAGDLSPLYFRFSSDGTNLELQSKPFQ